jgi:hypothetical protein
LKEKDEIERKKRRDKSKHDDLWVSITVKLPLSQPLVTADMFTTTC